MYDQLSVNWKFFVDFTVKFSLSMNWLWYYKLLVSVLWPIISNLDIFLYSPSDIVSSINELTLILNISGQFDVKHIMTLQTKTLLKILSLTLNYQCACSIGLAYAFDSICLYLQNFLYLRTRKLRISFCLFLLGRSLIIINFLNSSIAVIIAWVFLAFK